MGRLIIEGATMEHFLDELRTIVRAEIDSIKTSTSNKQVNNEEIFLNQKEVREILKCSPTTLWRLRKKEQFPSPLPGSKILFKKSDILNYLEKGQ